MKRILIVYVLFSFIFTLVYPAVNVSALTRNVRQAGLIDEMTSLGYTIDNNNVKIVQVPKGIDGEKGSTFSASSLPAFVTYRMGQDISFFNVYTQSAEEGQQDLIKVYSSHDGKHYFNVRLNDVETSSADGRYVKTYKVSRLSEGQKFLKIEFLSKDVQLLKVEINVTSEMLQTSKSKSKSTGSVFTDDMEDFTNMASYASGFRIDADKPEETAGDVYKLVAGSATEGASIVYKMNDNIAGFRIIKYVGNSARSNGQDAILKFYLSPDGEKYTEIQVSEESASNNGLIQMVQEELSVPAGNKFLKIEFTNVKVNWSPKIGKVEIYYGKQTGPIPSFFDSVGSGESGGVGREISTGVPLPSPAEVIAKLKEKSPNNTHPRLSATMEDFEKIKHLTITDEYMERWFDSVRNNADMYLELEPKEYEIPDGKRLLEVCREVLKRVKNLSMTYRVTGDRKYADRVWTELEKAGSFKDWNPSHFLDTAEMTKAFAIGYDWLYDCWTDEQKQFIKQAIVTKGLEEAIGFYRTNSNYTTSTNNWNSVCNAGIGMGALALGDENDVSQMAGEIIVGAIKSMPRAIAEMSPAGGYPEGPAYWDYANRYITYFIASMDSAVGTDYGLSEVPGFSETGNFPMYTSGGTGSFNFADSGEGFVSGSQLYWMARRFNKPEYSWYERNIFPNGNIDDMLWYDPDYYKTPLELDLPLDKRMEGSESIASFRNSWEEKSGLFAAIKGGDNQSSHGDLDVGTFIMDWEGIRWAKELGSETYDIPGYWDSNEKAGRWTYYRKRAEGHNTVVINPQKAPDQDVYAVCDIPVFESNPYGGYAVVDMSDAYKQSALSAMRGLMFFENRSRVMVQDEIINKKASDVYWFMHTQADIEISDNGKSAILTQRGKKMKADLISPSDAKFSVMDAKPLPETFSPPENLPNNGVTKLTVALKSVKQANISVVFTPIADEIDMYKELPVFTPMDKWEVKEVKTVKLDSITVAGKALEGFSPDRYSYTIEMPKDYPDVHEVKATGGEDADISITQSKGRIGTATINVTSKDENVRYSVYSIHFVKEPIIGKPEGTEEFVPVSVKASDVPQPENNEKNVLDKDLDTRWSAEGKPYLTFDLGDAKNVGGVAMAFYRGDMRKTTFDIAVSEDGEIWDKVYEGEACGTTSDFETFEFNVIKARYVKITGYGNTESGWSSISEVSILGKMK